MSVKAGSIQFVLRSMVLRQTLIIRHPCQLIASLTLTLPGGIWSWTFAVLWPEFQVALEFLPQDCILPFESGSVPLACFEMQLSTLHALQG